MKINDNGIVREMTATEIAEMKRMAEEMSMPSTTLEEQVAELREALDLLLLERR